MIEKKQEIVIGKHTKDFFSKYKSFSYGSIGKHLERKEEYEYITERLKQANLNYTPELYLSLIILTGVMVSLVSFTIYFLIFYIILNMAMWWLYLIILTSINTAAAFLFFPFIVSMKISNRKTNVERELPFVLSELSILASTGLSPIGILRRMARRSENEIVSAEFRRIIYKIDVEGKDLISALSEAASETPSYLFRENLWDLANMIHQGRNLDEYLRMKADQVMQIQREIQKGFIEKLARYSEMYISLVLVGILFLSIGAFLIDTMGETMMNLDADGIFILLTYGIIPMAVLVTFMIVSMAYSKSR